MVILSMPFDYKETLALPETAFPMKANLTQREPELLKFWQERDIYRKIQEKNRGKAHYILHDGPPYANGNIHIGHALNKILKDIIVKFKSMQGFYSPFVPGWDCHGLPIELQIDKNLGEKKDKTGVAEKRQLCRQYALLYVNIQREEFKRLGVFADWDKPYLTMTEEYESAIAEEFLNFVRGGYVYKGKKPVHWCPSCVTALAEAEVEYADKESPSVYVRFKIKDGALPELKGMNAYILIWTTTPWTLPANLALAVNSDYDYVAVISNNDAVIIARELKERLFPDGKVIAEYKGKDLEGLRTEHPFIERDSVVIPGDFVTVQEGTGIVHIAPGHGDDDYEAGIRYGLDIYAPLDDHGRFTEQAGEKLKGTFVFKANPLIIEILKTNNALFREEKITHSYPHCWRCKKPVIFRATEQWFISLKNNELRQRCLKEIENVRWIPSWGRDRIFNMVLNRPDWCISRQRAWGVPVALISCSECGSYVNDEDVFKKVIERFRRFSSDIWFSDVIADYLPEDYRCKTCGGSLFQKEKDILDVWFDSGVSHAAVLSKDERLSWPSDMYLEGSDQHRGWFQSSLITAAGTKGKAPYKTVLTHGFVVDGQGRKMSKSLGNVIAPTDVINKNGAEILRLWVSAEDYTEDVRLSKEIIDRLVEAYRKIRNTARFLLGNLKDFDGKDYSKDLLEIDRWAMSKLHGLIRRVTDAYENFEFHLVYHNIHNFCVIDMSSFYLDILKDRLYTFRKDSTERRAAQWVLYQILSVMTRLMAPIISFTAEEIWQFIPGDKEESVFLSDFPVPDNSFTSPELEERWARLIAIRDEVNKAMEIKRREKFIGNSLEAKVKLFLRGDDYDLLKQYEGFLPTLFIVSAVEISDSEPDDKAYKSSEIAPLSISIERAPGKKCERCWNWSESVGSFTDKPEICAKCYHALKKI